GDKHVSLRSIKSAHIGHLVNIRAMVARSSDVKPMAKADHPSPLPQAFRG
ncbi:hypothetical protein T484DRAFT_1866862, partial [Baffinella frigidus]